MPTEFKLPELGENVTAGDVVRVLVKPGDAIKNDQPVLELETDKATIEVPSSVSGTIKDIKVKTGDKVKVGQTVLVVEDGGGAKESAPAAGAEKPTPQPAAAAEEGGLSQVAPGQATETAPADAGQADKNGEARRRSEWELDADDDAPAEPAAEQTAAATPPPPAAQAAYRLPEDHVETPSPKPKRGEVVEISRGARVAAPAEPAPASEGLPPAAAPSVRRVARELGVDIRRVPPSGPGGRITVDDVQGFVKQSMADATASEAAAPAAGGAPAPGPAPAQPLPDFAKWGEVERKPMSNIRRKTAEHLSHAWNTIPHVTQHDKADITALEHLREQYGPQAERAGGKLTVTAIALKAVAAALRRFPQFAASVDMARSQIVYKKYVHIGIAVDTERGLLVPVIRDVDRKGIIELAVELATASEKARAGKLSLDDMSGGVFSISNLGGIGGTAFTPVVNWPEVAILGISRSSFEPVYDGKAFHPRMMLPLSLSYDHRLVDGADAARFLRWVAEAFEQPFVLTL
jgi:pyruvate dehydrogenase E2 component (dihydrolipoamide acetyltransferase)